MSSRESTPGIDPGQRERERERRERIEARRAFNRDAAQDDLDDRLALGGTQNVEFQDFVERCMELNEPRFDGDEVDASKRFTEYCLTGIDPDDQRQTIVSMDNCDIAASDFNTMSVQRDYDSFLGMSTALPFATDITFLDSPDLAGAMKSNFKVRFDVTTKDGSVSLSLSYFFCYSRCRQKSDYVGLYWPTCYACVPSMCVRRSPTLIGGSHYSVSSWC